MPPEQTATASIYSDAAVENATSAIASFATSPADRATLAANCARLASRNGGLGTSNYTTHRYAGYADSYHAARPTLSRVCPDATSAIPITSPAHPSTIGFATALTHISTTLTSVRQQFATLDADTRTWVDGTVHSAHTTRTSPPSMTSPPPLTRSRAPRAKLDRAFASARSRLSSIECQSVARRQACLRRLRRCKPHRRGPSLRSRPPHLIFPGGCRRVSPPSA